MTPHEHEIDNLVSTTGGFYYDLVSKLALDLLNASGVGSEMTFTDDARQALVRGTVEYAKDVFYEVGDDRRTRDERIETIDERLRVLRAEMAELEDEKRTLRAARRETMTTNCLHEAVERVADRGRAIEAERRRREEERDRRAVEPPRLCRKSSKD